MAHVREQKTKTNLESYSLAFKEIAKGLIWLVVAAELAFIGYLGYDFLQDSNSKDASASVVTDESTGKECIIQYVKGEAFKLCQD